ncbi:cytosolic carboxypeptidase-like protein 5 [Culicoides brevitarsis]|uniref:cytosolic carboxypeptidase-like protein 5 n=1 Tax=Culicoides brevitarsis TaxID=469753 RepID=UPI00307BE2ED
MIENYGCGGFEFDAAFDSGNLGKVELSKVYNEGTEKTAPDNVIDIEFNLWTKPDCAGTPYENSNRTWFFFSITGGRPYQVVKINIMNLNKQAKLFSQGMHPVIRVGPNGKWERIKEKPAYFMTNDSFILTFLHKNSDKPDAVKIYYAFTFPYTYTEQQDQLAIYDERFGKDSIEVDRIIKEINKTKAKSDTKQQSQDDAATKETRLEEQLFKAGTNPGQKTIEIYSCDSQTSVTCSLEYLRNNFEIKSTEEILKKNESAVHAMAVDENTSESMQQITSLVNNVRIELQQKTTEICENAKQSEKSDKPPTDFNDEIYYHRELLIRSYEGRRVDLLTISSFHGITDKREERIQSLFPEFLTPRCHVFKDKKVVFISSRVHPGETPASFVLNGFLTFLLDRKNVVAQALRKMYLFKIVPFLNPDGVYNGLYRSDVLGHNLNRVYLNPNRETQPSIYAARKLIRFHHFGYDKPETERPVTPKSPQPPPTVVNVTNESNMTAYSGGDECETIDQMTSETATTTIADACDFMKDCDENATDLGLFSEQHSSRESSTSSNLDEKLTTFILPSTNEPEKQSELRLTKSATQLTTTTNTSTNVNNNNSNQKSLPAASQIPRPNTSTSARSSKESVKSQTSTGSAKDRVALKNALNLRGSNVVSASPVPARVGTGAVILKKVENAKTLSKKGSQDKTQKTNPAQISHHFRSHRNDYGPGQKCLNISLDFLTEIDEKGTRYINEENSGMFLYIDLHGHASKKGVFMYGNHLPTTMEAVECMLLPKLMSLNSLHFHYDGCNFSEKNMYLKGKRDGLSKEGSGRVAIYKMTGLIKAYTLESNYNTGKYVNILPPKGKDVDSYPSKSTVAVPPKYTPAIFEDVGRALGPSILDLTGSNPQPRLHNSEYRTLQGLRNALKNELERGPAKPRSASKVSKAKTKRAGSLPENKEIAKENKVASKVGVVGSGNNNVGSNSNSSSNSISISSGSRQQSTSNAKLGKKIFTKTNFVKKDAGIAGSSTSNVKKPKILGESSSSSALKTDRANKESNQIPRKKIKVSPQHRIETTEPLITCFGETSIKYTKAVDSFDMCAYSNTTATFSSASLPNFFTQTPACLVETDAYGQQVTKRQPLELEDSLDAVPCCSYSLPSTSEPALLGSSSSGAMRSASLHSITRTKEFKSKFSKATSSKPKVTKTGEKVKMKKKRTLRADSALKRKKNRVKPVVC